MKRRKTTSEYIAFICMHSPQEQNSFYEENLDEEDHSFQEEEETDEEDLAISRQVIVATQLQWRTNLN